jgi:hypothetical protein
MMGAFILVRPSQNLCGGRLSTQDPQIFNIPFDFPFLFRPLLHAQNYLWCRANPTLKVSIFGLLTIPTSRR